MSCDVLTLNVVIDAVILAVFVTNLQIGSACDFTAETI